MSYRYFEFDAFQDDFTLTGDFQEWPEMGFVGRVVFSADEPDVGYRGGAEIEDLLLFIGDDGYPTFAYFARSFVARFGSQVSETEADIARLVERKVDKFMNGVAHDD